MNNLMSDMLSLAWALAQLTGMVSGMGGFLRWNTVDLGSKLDDAACTKTTGSETEEECVEFLFPGIPYAQINLPGIMVIFKPDNWEVNRGDPDVHRSEVEWRLLSDWLALALPRSRFPLAHSSEFDFGFIHRLDVPSSGLIMSAKKLCWPCFAPF